MSREDLVKLYNTLLTIETKGENTKTMCDCLRFIEQSVKNYQENQSTGEKCSESSEVEK